MKELTLYSILISVIILLLVLVYLSLSNSDKAEGEIYTLPKEGKNTIKKQKSKYKPINKWNNKDHERLENAIEGKIKSIFNNEKIMDKILGKNLTDYQLYKKFHRKIIAFMKGFDIGTESLNNKEIATLIKDYILSGKSEDPLNIEKGEYL